jgi:hypothetical protein
MRYKIGDLVLVKSMPMGGTPSRVVHEIDGVTEKVVNGQKVISYEAGDQRFLEASIEGKVILEKPRSPRTRKPKMSSQIDLEPETAPEPAKEVMP